MDAFLSEEARRYLKGQAFDTSRYKRDGLLLGHRRAQRFFIERAFSCRESTFSVLKNFLALNRHFEGKIIGFFSLNSGPGERTRLFKPFAYGKVFLKIKAGKNRRLAMKPYVIEYKDSFFLLPISFHSPPREKP